jgi:hypothetical protein
MPVSFKESVCSHYGIPSEHYERELILQTLHPHARRIWPVLELTGGKTVFSSRQLADMVADTVTRDDMIDVINEYYKDLKPKAGFLVNALDISISCRKLLALHDQLRAARPK